MSGPHLTQLRNGVSLAVGLVTLPSLLVLGTDAVLAAAPATPLQLAHACLAAGWNAVIPASWGDELIAAQVMREVRAADSPRLQCSCPHVERRLSAHGAAITPVTIRTVAPPVATALYLRAQYAPEQVRVTFAGACPAGAHPSIDERIMPQELLAALGEHGIDPRRQPTEFDSVIPPDRRRFYSEPGGLPSRRLLAHGEHRVELVELAGGDLIVEMAEQLLRPGRSLVDVAPSHGCSCCGAAGLAGLEYARARVQEREPPRAPSPVVDHDVRLPIITPTSSPVVAPAVVAIGAEAAAVAVKRRSPAGMPRVSTGIVAQTRSQDGRPLPRAYIAKRRSSPRGVRPVPRVAGWLERLLRFFRPR